MLKWRCVCDIQTHASCVSRIVRGTTCDFLQLVLEEKRTREVCIEGLIVHSPNKASSVIDRQSHGQIQLERFGGHRHGLLWLDGVNWRIGASCIVVGRDRRGFYRGISRFVDHCSANSLCIVVSSTEKSTGHLWAHPVTCSRIGFTHDQDVRALTNSKRHYGGVVWSHRSEINGNDGHYMLVDRKVLDA